MLDLNQTAAWLAQAKTAIKQGQSLVDFVASAHPDNRQNARKAWISARKSQRFLSQAKPPAAPQPAPPDRQ